MYKYFAYGLNISSELELDELIARDFIGEADIEIKLGECPDQITGPDWYGGWWQADDEYLLCDFTDIIRALVSRNGEEVTLQVFTEDDFQLRSFIYGQVLSACLLLKDYYLLHGACVKIGDKAVGFCGASGVGKSTLAWGFMKEGYTVYSDDVIALKIEEGKVIMYPGFPRLRLRKEIFGLMSIDDSLFSEIKHAREKKNFTGMDELPMSPVELTKLVVLKVIDTDKVSRIELKGGEALLSLQDTAYRTELEQHIFDDKTLLDRSTKLANHTRMNQVERTNHYFCLDEVLEKVHSILMIN